MRRSGMVLSLGMATAAACSGVSSYEVPEGEDIFSVVEGEWDWEHAEGRCVADPITIGFSPGRDTMYLRHREPVRWTDGTERVVTPYEVREVTGNRIRGFIPHETRTTDDGELVVWDLLLKSEDRFCWHRTDWWRYDCTRGVVRCPPAEAVEEVTTADKDRSLAWKGLTAPDK